MTLSSRAQLDRLVTERDWLMQVTKMARVNGWRYTHFRTALSQDGHWLTAISGNKGFPDLVLVRGSRIIFAELKTERGKMTIDQELWINALRYAADHQSDCRRIGVYVWRPSDRDEVARVLARAA